VPPSKGEFPVQVRALVAAEDYRKKGRDPNFGWIENFINAMKTHLPERKGKASIIS